MYKLCTVAQAEELTQTKRPTLMKLAKKHNCVRKIGNRNYRIDIEKLLKCLEQEA